MNDQHPAMTTGDVNDLRDTLIRAVITADIDWSGRNTSTWDRGASVVDAILVALPAPAPEDREASAAAPECCPSCGSDSRFTVKPPCSLDQYDPDAWHRSRPAAAAPDEREALLAQAWEAAQRRYPGESGLTDTSRGAFIIGWSSALDAALTTRPAPAVNAADVERVAYAIFREHDKSHEVTFDGVPRTTSLAAARAALAALGIPAPAAEGREG